MIDAIETIYLDWRNNFLTVEGYASHYNISIEQAEKLIAVATDIYKYKNG